MSLKTLNVLHWANKCKGSMYMMGRLVLVGSRIFLGSSIEHRAIFENTKASLDPLLI